MITPVYLVDAFALFVLSVVAMFAFLGLSAFSDGLFFALPFYAAAIASVPVLVAGLALFAAALGLFVFALIYTKASFVSAPASQSFPWRSVWTAIMAMVKDTAGSVYRGIRTLAISIVDCADFSAAFLRNPLVYINDMIRRQRRRSTPWPVRQPTSNRFSAATRSASPRISEMARRSATAAASPHLLPRTKSSATTLRAPILMPAAIPVGFTLPPVVPPSNMPTTATGTAQPLPPLPPTSFSSTEIMARSSTFSKPTVPNFPKFETRSTTGSTATTSGATQLIGSESSIDPTRRLLAPVTADAKITTVSYAVRAFVSVPARALGKQASTSESIQLARRVPPPLKKADSGVDVLATQVSVARVHPNRVPLVAKDISTAGTTLPAALQLAVPVGRPAILAAQLECAKEIRKSSASSSSSTTGGAVRTITSAIEIRAHLAAPASAIADGSLGVARVPAVAHDSFQQQSAVTGPPPVAVASSAATRAVDPPVTCIAAAASPAAAPQVLGTMVAVTSTTADACHAAAADPRRQVEQVMPVSVHFSDPPISASTHVVEVVSPPSSVAIVLAAVADKSPAALLDAQPAVEVETDRPVGRDSTAAGPGTRSPPPVMDMISAPPNETTTVANESSAVLPNAAVTAVVNRTADSDTRLTVKAESDRVPTCDPTAADLAHRAAASGSALSPDDAPVDARPVPHLAPKALHASLPPSIVRATAEPVSASLVAPTRLVNSTTSTAPATHPLQYYQQLLIPALPAYHAHVSAIPLVTVESQPSVSCMSPTWIPAPVPRPASETSSTTRVPASDVTFMVKSGPLRKTTAIAKASRHHLYRQLLMDGTSTMLLQHYRAPRTAPRRRHLSKEHTGSPSAVTAVYPTSRTSARAAAATSQHQSLVVVDAEPVCPAASGPSTASSTLVEARDPVTRAASPVAPPAWTLDGGALASPVPVVPAPIATSPLPTRAGVAATAGYDAVASESIERHAAAASPAQPPACVTSRLDQPQVRDVQVQLGGSTASLVAPTSVAAVIADVSTQDCAARAPLAPASSVVVQEAPAPPSRASASAFAMQLSFPQRYTSIPHPFLSHRVTALLSLSRSRPSQTEPTYATGYGTGSGRGKRMRVDPRPAARPPGPLADVLEQLSIRDAAALDAEQPAASATSAPVPDHLSLPVTPAIEVIMDSADASASSKTAVSTMEPVLAPVAAAALLPVPTLAPQRVPAVTASSSSLPSEYGVVRPGKRAFDDMDPTNSIALGFFIVSKRARVNPRTLTDSTIPLPLTPSPSSATALDSVTLGDQRQLDAPASGSMELDALISGSEASPSSNTRSATVLGCSGPMSLSGTSATSDGVSTASSAPSFTRTSPTAGAVHIETNSFAAVCTAPRSAGCVDSGASSSSTNAHGTKFMKAGSRTASPSDVDLSSTLAMDTSNSDFTQAIETASGASDSPRFSDWIGNIVHNSKVDQLEQQLDRATRSVLDAAPEPKRVMPGGRSGGRDDDLSDLLGNAFRTTSSTSADDDLPEWLRPYSRKKAAKVVDEDDDVEEVLQIFD
ncbi:hypothetical protein H9P43_007367 [Blastocladiella emersonii ATCC 22665]|nr:hypothetical protein H9P43_007367 [Blastocladiella emersonii ATCC 22665]